MVCFCHQFLLNGVSIFGRAVALFAPCLGLRAAAAPWLCQGWILLGWSQGEAQLWQELLGFLSASWDCSFLCLAQAVVPAAACAHKGDLSLCEQQSSQLSQECDPGCHAAANGHGLGPCQPAAAPHPRAGGSGGGQCSWAGIAQCTLGCDTHQPEKVLGDPDLLADCTLHQCGSSHGAAQRAA